MSNIRQEKGVVIDVEVTARKRLLVPQDGDFGLFVTKGSASLHDDVVEFLSQRDLSTKSPSLSFRLYAIDGDAVADAGDAADFDGQTVVVFLTVIVVENGPMPWKLDIQHRFLLLHYKNNPLRGAESSAERKSLAVGFKLLALSFLAYFTYT